MKDIMGNILNVGDEVAFIYKHSKSSYYITHGVVQGIKGTKLIQIKPHASERITGFFSSEDGTQIRVVKTEPAVRVGEGPHDALGHPVCEGDKFVFMRQVKNYGSITAHQDGFEDGGVITGISECFVYFEKDGKRQRTALHHIVKI